MGVANNCPVFNMIKIKYIGKRDVYIEGCYGSKIEFVRGESMMVEKSLAAKLLKHKDQYIEDIDPKVKVKEALAEVNTVDDDPLQDVRDSIATLDKQSLIDFVQENFAGTKLDKRKSEEVLRVEVTQLIDQYGIG